jgi:hypothetical protein
VLLTEDDTAIVAMNDGGDAFTHTSISFTQVAFLDLGDLDGDGYDDLAVSGNAGLSWLANDGTGQFGAPQELLVGTMQGVAIEDMDLDGDEDHRRVLDGRGSGRLPGERRRRRLRVLGVHDGGWTRPPRAGRPQRRRIPRCGQPRTATRPSRGS